MISAQELAEAEAGAASARLKMFPKLPNGLTPDDVKTSPEYRAAKADWNRAFAKLRKINAARLKTAKGNQS